MLVRGSPVSFTGTSPDDRHGKHSREKSRKRFQRSGVIFVDQLATGRPYLVMLNSNRPGKNAARVFTGLDPLRPHLENKAVIAMIGLRNDQYRFLSRRFPLASDYIIPIPYLDRSVLRQTLESSLGLFFPSISEGYGYPSVEAMNLGIPILAAASTAIPEVAGDAALYFNPYSLGEIAVQK